MATVLNLAARGVLSKLEVELDWREQEVRRFYALPRLRTWLCDVLPTAESTWNREVSPAEQLDALLAIYIAGEPIAFENQLKPLRHRRQGVWELKTADVRIFGWFPSRDCFIGSAGYIADGVKHLELYNGFIEQAAHDIAVIDLDPPKFVSGENPHAVVSDFYYP
jgi:hypothetical protein